MGLPSTPYFLCFHYFGPTVTHSHFSTSYIAHDLLFLFFRAPLSPFTSSRPICLSHGPMIHYSCRLGLMSFISICQLLSVRVTGLLLPTWASKMALNTSQCNWRGCYPKLATSLENILPYFPFLCWHLWLARNEHIFHNQSSSQNRLIYKTV